MKLLDKIIDFLLTNPEVSYYPKKKIESVPQELNKYMRFFNTNLNQYIFDFYVPFGDPSPHDELPKVIFIGSLPKEVWEENHWCPLFSFYLDKKVGTNHFLRKIEGGYLPIQQIYEEYIFAKSEGTIEMIDKENNQRCFESHLGSIINEFELHKDFYKLEKVLYGKLLKSVFTGEEIEHSYKIIKTIPKLNQYIPNDIKQLIVFFGNENHTIYSETNKIKVQDFLNLIYLNICNSVPRHTYGENWLLYNVETFDLIVSSEFNRDSLLSESVFSHGIYVVLLKKSIFSPPNRRTL